jgi:uncharacterized protein with gpF-like domain
MPSILPIGVTPAQAIEYYRRKGYKFSFAWEDMLREEHAKAFTVAKVMRADVLDDIRKSVDRALADGITIDEFRRELTPTLQSMGWWGQKVMTDPLTGKDKLAQLGSPRRLATIYDTNLRTSMSAGQWDQIQETKAKRPYLRYVHSGSLHPRAEHKAWNGLVLPVDHPFWNTHMPPNGWHCGCYVQQLNDRDLGRYGYSVGNAPPIQMRAWTNKRTGETERVPIGIDPGFNYNPGIAGLKHYETLLNQRIDAAPADLRDALSS